MELTLVTAETAVRWQAVEAAALDHDFVGTSGDPVEEALTALSPSPGPAPATRCTSAPPVASTSSR